MAPAEPRSLRPEFEGLDDVLVCPTVHVGIPADFGNEAQERGVEHRNPHDHEQDQAKRLPGGRLGMHSLVHDEG